MSVPEPGVSAGPLEVVLPLQVLGEVVAAAEPDRAQVAAVVRALLKKLQQFRTQHSAQAGH